MLVYRVISDDGALGSEEVSRITVDGETVTWTGPDLLVQRLQKMCRKRGHDPQTPAGIEDLYHIVSGSYMWIVKEDGDNGALQA